MIQSHPAYVATGGTYPAHVPGAYPNLPCCEGVTMPTITVRGPEDTGEVDRATIRANGIVVDVIAREDGGVYVEMYAYGRQKRAIVERSFTDAYKVTNPNLTLRLIDRERAS